MPATTSQSWLCCSSRQSWVWWSQGSKAGACSADRSPIQVVTCWWVKPAGTVPPVTPFLLKEEEGGIKPGFAKFGRYCRSWFSRSLLSVPAVLWRGDTGAGNTGPPSTLTVSPQFSGFRKVSVSSVQHLGSLSGGKENLKKLKTASYQPDLLSRAKCAPKPQQNKEVNEIP